MDHFTHLPLAHRMRTRPRRFTWCNAHTIHMVAAEYESNKHGHDQTEGGPNTVGYVATTEICYCWYAIENAATIHFDARVKHIFPMMPGNGRRNTAHKAARNNEWIQICQNRFTFIWIQCHDWLVYCLAWVHWEFFLPIYDGSIRFGSITRDST